MTEAFPIVSWFDEPIKKSISSVFNGMNDFVESIDLIKKYRNAHFNTLRYKVSTVKILGMQKPLSLESIYYPTSVSTDIRRRIYSPDWETIGVGKAKPQNTKIRLVEAGYKYIEANPRTVVLGGPGAGKTTFLKYLALAYCDKAVFARTGLRTTYFPIYLNLPLITADTAEILDHLSQILKRQTLHDQ